MIVYASVQVCEGSDHRVVLDVRLIGVDAIPSVVVVDKEATESSLVREQQLLDVESKLLFRYGGPILCVGGMGMIFILRSAGSASIYFHVI